MQTADSLLILHQEMWVQFVSPGLTLMSYSTCRPDSAVALGNLLRKWHSLSVHLLWIPTLWSVVTLGKVPSIYVVAGRREDVSST